MRAILHTGRGGCYRSGSLLRHHHRRILRRGEALQRGDQSPGPALSVIGQSGRLMGENFRTSVPIEGMRPETCPTILVIDADSATRTALADELTADGFAAIACGSCEQGRELLTSAFPDAVIVDSLLPDGSGLELVAAIRGADVGGERVDAGLPVLVVSARCGESDRVRAFEFGADDFLARPFSYRELRGRLLARLRPRDQRRGRRAISAGAVALDPVTRSVRVGERPVLLTQKEFSLLHVLVSDPQRVFTKHELLRAVWGYRAPQAANTRTLDSHACRLRGKLGAAGAGALIQNVWGVGYRLLDPDLTGTIA